jgi:tetratricopeptide (TPR) repeat protein
MKRSGWKFGGMMVASLLAMVAMMSPGKLLAQAPTASIHGHVTNPAGLPLGKGQVKLTPDRTGDVKTRKFPYSFPIDANGDYKGEGIAPGTYVGAVFQDDKSVDFNDNVVFVAGEDKTINFDMSRQEYINKMTPEEKKQLEDYKKANAAVAQTNAKISNLNALLVQARADNKAGNYDAAMTGMKTATSAKADEPILWVTLGDAQLGAANKSSAALKSAGKPNDDATKQLFTDAETSYKKAIDLGTAAKKPNPETIAVAYNQLGQAYGRSGDAKASSDAYDMAAKTLPASAGTYLYNEAATLYNAGMMDEAAAAADKAIAADPKRAEAYYIKGQALIPKATVDPKTQKIVAPPGCVEAYQEYLELAPDGPHAADVKGILAGIGAQIKSTYKAGKK